MEIRRDKLDEYIMYAEEFNRYLAFAMSSGNYATLHEDDANTNYQGDFELYQERDAAGVTVSNQKKVLVKSDHVFGLQCPVEQLVFDILHDATENAKFEWSVAAHEQAGLLPDPKPFAVEFGVTVRAILSEFETDEVTWNNVYGGASPLSFHATSLYVVTGGNGGAWPHLEGQIALTAQSGPSMDPVPGDAVIAATVSTYQYFPFLVYAKLSDGDTGSGALAAWNVANQVFGFEISVSASAEDQDGQRACKFSWVGDVSDSDTARCFVVLA